MTGSAFIKTTGTATQPTAGQMPLLEYSRAQRELNKPLLSVYSRGDVCGFKAPADMDKDDGTAVNDFAVALVDGLSGEPKGVFAIGGAAVLVNVSAGQTASYNSPLVVDSAGNAGKVKDQVAEAVSKICGVSWGTIDQQDGKVRQADVVGPALCLMYIQPWKITV